MSSVDFNPLRPAGHLPHKGGETVRGRFANGFWLQGGALRDWAREGHGASRMVVSPLVGEMTGRPEGELP